MDRLASKLGVRTDVPNQALAREIAVGEDLAAVAELVSGLSGGEKSVRSDCIKTLYEIGYLKPKLIASHTAEFLRLLTNRDNRLVWGAMIALSTVAALAADEILRQIDTVYRAMREGSVITADNAVKALAAVAAARPESGEDIFVHLVEHLRTCRPKEVPQHAESIFPAVTAGNRDTFLSALQTRESGLTPSQMARIRRLYQKANQPRL